MSVYKFRRPVRPVSRVFIHCSASDNPDHDNVATMDLWHKQRGWSGVGYHLFIRKSGLIEIGRDLEKVPSAQVGHNTGTIAICLHGLDKDKFTLQQFDALVGLCHQINEAYGGKVTFHGHREVAKKACPVFDYWDVLGLTPSGVLPRRTNFAAAVKLEVAWLPEDTRLEEPDVLHHGILKPGVCNGEVASLQKRLAALGYFPGAFDGRYGERTRAAVLAFQADNHLVTDGLYGPATREALKDAPPRPLSEKRQGTTVASLAKGGSRIAQASATSAATGLLFAGGGALTVVEQTSGIVSQLTGYAGIFGEAMTRLGPWIGGAILIGGALIVWQSIRAAKARAEDHRTGKTA